MNELPPTSGLALAISRLPRPRAGVPAQVADVEAFPHTGCFQVTFVVRRNIRPECRAWFWGIESAEQVTRPSARVRGARVHGDSAMPAVVADPTQEALLPV